MSDGKRNNNNWAAVVVVVLFAVRAFYAADIDVRVLVGYSYPQLIVGWIANDQSKE